MSHLKKAAAATAAHHKFVKGHHAGGDTHAEQLKVHGHNIEEMNESMKEMMQEEKTGEE